MCDPMRRDGIYLAKFEKLSGTCGELVSQLVRVDGDATGPGAGCALTADDAWRDGNCTLERSIRCMSDGVVVDQTSTSTQEDAAGEFISGLLTQRLSGASSCIGTYRVEFQRQ